MEHDARWKCDLQGLFEEILINDNMAVFRMPLILTHRIITSYAEIAINQKNVELMSLLAELSVLTNDNYDHADNRRFITREQIEQFCNSNDNAEVRIDGLTDEDLANINTQRARQMEINTLKQKKECLKDKRRECNKKRKLKMEVEK